MPASSAGRARTQNSRTERRTRVHERRTRVQERRTRVQERTTRRTVAIMRESIDSGTMDRLNALTCEPLPGAETIIDSHFPS